MPVQMAYLYVAGFCVTAFHESPSLAAGRLRSLSVALLSLLS